MINRERTKHVVLIALIISFCILAAGLSGRIVMTGITNKVMSMNMLDSLGNDLPELEKVLNRGAGKMLIKLTVSLIKNDSSGFVNVAKEIIKSIGSIGGESGLSGLVLNPIIAEIAEAAFQEAHAALVESAGAYLPMLQFAAYCSELLVIGGIAAAVSLLLWFVMNGRMKDIIKARKPMIAGAVWVSAVIVMTILVQGRILVSI